ncbi:MAG: hypothetical protein KIT56_06915 [Gammaproteobacteria bacterium]|nr:hypothetical protein [Gammaproteobacteria bacterium]MCW5583597.1 hypothetical protein [Gammaproteobacteria bacterium]
MNKPHKSFSVDECKIQASILLKSLHSKNLALSLQAAKRFQRLTEFKNLTLEEIIQSDIKRKHALLVIAIEKGFPSWANLKCQLPFIRGGFLNHWFVNYAEAQTYQQLNGGFLLPFKNQFFICDADYINDLGFDSNDHDWRLIGFDWVEPKNKLAWQRLYQKWMKIQGENHE